MFAQLKCVCSVCKAHYALGYQVSFRPFDRAVTSSLFAVPKKTFPTLCVKSCMMDLYRSCEVCYCWKELAQDLWLVLEQEWMWETQAGKSADGTLADIPAVTVALVSTGCNLWLLWLCPRLCRCRGQYQYRAAISPSCESENQKPGSESWKREREKKHS